MKEVLPAILPALAYHDLAIADGVPVSIAWEWAIQGEDSAEGHRVFSDLREYCRRDTLGLWELRRTLSERAQSAIK